MMRKKWTTKKMFQTDSINEDVRETNDSIRRNEKISNRTNRIAKDFHHQIVVEEKKQNKI